jgi:licheninase
MKKHLLHFLLGPALLVVAAAGCTSDNGSTTTTDAAPTPQQQADATVPGDANKGSTDTTPAATQATMIDDFEDGNGMPLIGSGGWYVYDDQTPTDKGEAGKSTISVSGATGSEIKVIDGEGANGSKKALQVEFTLDQGTLTYPPFVGFGVSLGTATAPYDASGFESIVYTYKGPAHTVRLEVTEVTDYDEFAYSVSASADWKTVTVAISSLAQEGWGKPVTLNPAHLKNLSYQIRGKTGDAGKLLVDDLKFMGTASNKPAGPDMTIKPVAPPVKTNLGDITISNPLQAKAAKYLSRGYNITNWLEQGKFKDFTTYNETYVANLAKAGFKSLRLPIDLDLYAKRDATTKKYIQPVEVEETLWTVLDSFNKWTKASGMSFTVDYHGYDKSLSTKDQASLDVAVEMWGKVAEHFATEAREDLFFELLNEPELSFSDSGRPTAADWGSLADKMVTAIRALDKTHTLLFGDVAWYGIGALAKRTPLTDTNVIYIVHFYDPFVFTHQGASWADLSTSHGVPWPYSPERWSESYSTFGMAVGKTPSWLLQQADNYNVLGTKENLYNLLAEAKKWAVKNNVPVICNEFGVYDRSSLEQDRFNYYTDLINVFDELQIPWQLWFMIMDAKTGAVLPGYTAAFKLGT